MTGLAALVGGAVVALFSLIFMRVILECSTRWCGSRRTSGHAQPALTGDGQRCRGVGHRPRRTAAASVSEEAE